jgi:hypothetical protein
MGSPARGTRQPAPGFNAKIPTIMVCLDEGQTNARLGPPILGSARRSVIGRNDPSHDGRCTMESHTIRLRGGWECAPVEAPDSGSTRLSLPARRESLPPGRLRLTRRFQRPPLAGDMTVLLRLSRCPGIRSITINGRPIGPTSPDRSEFGLSLPRLSPRNELVIEAEPPRSDAEWGAVSLDFVSGT